jgi:hypothetical protein
MIYEESSKKTKRDEEKKMKRKCAELPRRIYIEKTSGRFWVEPRVIQDDSKLQIVHLFFSTRRA